MTKTASIAIAISLLVNEIYILNIGSLVKGEGCASNLVFLISACLLLKKVNIFPRVLWRKSSVICLLLEIVTTQLILESSVIFIWKRIQEYILSNADGILVYLVEKQNLDWLVCHMCCGKADCQMIFARILLKVLSFIGLLCVVGFS